MDRASLCSFTYATIHGPLTISATAKGICAIEFGQGPGEGRHVATELTHRAANQMQEYLAGKRRSFDVPLDIEGSAFQKTVWAQADATPYGTTTTATELAKAIGKPGSHRSVGTALRQCRVAPFIAVHRIENPAATGKGARIYRALCAMEKANL